MQALLAPLINLTILVVFLVVKLRVPLRSFVAERHVRLRDQIHSVRQQLGTAQEKYEEFSAKLKTVDSEIAVLREQARQDAQGVKQRAASEVQRLSASVVAQSRETSAQLYAELKDGLYHELAVRALARAEAVMKDRLTGDDKARLRKEFSLQMESVQ